MQTMSPADGETVEVVDGVHLTQLVAGDRTSVEGGLGRPRAGGPRPVRCRSSLGMNI